VSWYQKGKNNLDFTGARDSEWQRHQLGHMQVCTSLQTDNDASNPPLSFLQAGRPSCRPTNSVKALKGYIKSSKEARKNTRTHSSITVKGVRWQLLQHTYTYDSSTRSLAFPKSMQLPLNNGSNKALA